MTIPNPFGGKGIVRGGSPGQFLAKTGVGFFLVFLVISLYYSNVNCLGLAVSSLFFAAFGFQLWRIERQNPDRKEELVNEGLEIENEKLKLELEQSKQRALRAERGLIKGKMSSEMPEKARLADILKNSINLAKEVGERDKDAIIELSEYIQKLMMEREEK